MQPTVPAWVSWYRRLRPRDSYRSHEPRESYRSHEPRESYRSHESRASLRARAPNRIAVYTFGRDDPTTHLIRLDSVLGPKRVAPTPPAWRPERFPGDAESWRVPVPVMPDVSTRFHFEPISIVVPGAPPTTEPPGGGAAPSAHGWGGAARGWAAGTVLLAVLVLLVRTAEKCLDKKLFHHQNAGGAESGSLPRLADAAAHHPADPPDVDLPPPYSACAASVGATKLAIIEEPPPPYSACYVSFPSPRDGPPSVHFFNRRRQMVDHGYEIGQSSSDVHSTDRTDLAEDVGAGAASGAGRSTSEGRAELVFANGRIVERRDVGSGAAGQGTEAVRDHCDNSTQDRVALA